MLRKVGTAAIAMIVGALVLVVAPQAQAIEGGGRATGGTSGAASIYRGMVQVCSGSVINARTILTAKHCVRDDVGNPGHLEVVSALEPELGDPVAVKSIRLNGRADIAILRLKAPGPTRASNVILARNNPNLNAHCQVYGYGWTKMAPPPAKWLKFANVQWGSATQDGTGGRGAHWLEWNDGMVRRGDSGGPVFCGNSGIQHGITVQQVGDRRGKAQSVATWRAWITENSEPAS